MYSMVQSHCVMNHKRCKFVMGGGFYNESCCVRPYCSLMQGEHGKICKVFSCDVRGHFYSWNVGGKPGQNHSKRLDSLEVRGEIIGEPQFTRRGETVLAMVPMKYSQKERGIARWTLELIVEGESTWPSLAHYSIFLNYALDCRLLLIFVSRAFRNLEIR